MKRPKEQEVSAVTKALTEYVAAATRKPLPKEVSSRAKLHLVDTFSAMISGSTLLPGKKAINYVKALRGRPEVGVIGTRLVTSAGYAALANGMFGHGDETDDTHPSSITHPGCSIVPAAVAIGELNGLSGREVLRAIVLGYDVCSRIMHAVQPHRFMRAGHNPCAFGQMFGSAAAAAALLRLKAEDVRYVFSYAGQQAAGLATMLRDPEHIEKSYCMGGMPAQNGIAAALMVKHGFSGVADVFSGERNFFYTFAPTDGNPEELARGLGRDFEILRAAIKRWPAGGPIQGPLHVTRELIERHKLKAEQIEEIVIRMPDKELDIVNNRPMPDISIQHLVAVMLIDGAVTFASAHDFGRVKDKAVQKLREHIKVVGDPSLTDTQRRWRAVVEVTLKNGSQFKNQTMAARGSYENPLTPKELEEKSLDLIAPVLKKTRALNLLKGLWKFETIENIRSLRRLYTP